MDITVVSPKTVAIKNVYIELIKDEVNIKNVKFNGTSDKILVELNTELTPELKQEGLKREFVRTINALRKKMGLTIQNKVEVYYFAENEIKDMIKKYQIEILKDTLSLSIIEKKDIDNKKIKINNLEISIILEKNSDK